jgi:hypothetical protein
MKGAHVLQVGDGVGVSLVVTFIHAVFFLHPKTGRRHVQAPLLGKNASFRVTLDIPRKVTKIENACTITNTSTNT